MSRVRTALMAAAVVLMLVGTGIAVSRGTDDAVGAEQGRLDVDGTASVEHPDGTSDEVTDDSTVHFGDVVTVTDGSATLTLAGGEVYELRSGPADTVLEVGAPPILLAGDALVRDGFPAQLRYDTATLSTQGAMKMVSGVPRVVAYAGRTRIDGAGELDELRGLRQVVLTSLATPDPLAYDGSDPWDRRYLGEAIAFGERLEALARGSTADLGPGGGRSATFFEAVLPALGEELEFSADLLEPDRPAGETLVGAAIVVEGRTGTFRDRWEQVFAFRDAGAAWGIVALDQGVSTAPLLDTIEFAVTAPPVPTSSSTTSSSTTTEPPSTTTSPPTTDGGAPTTTTTTTTTTTPEPPPTTDLLEPVLDPVGELLDDLLDVLGLG